MIGRENPRDEISIHAYEGVGKGAVGLAPG
jgi:hypothetical protein